VHTKDKATLYILYRAIDEYDFEKIASVKSLKEACDILEKRGGSSNEVGLASNT